MRFIERATRRQKTSRRRVPVPLLVEQLEDRTVPSLVAAYGFDDGAGTAAADASGHGLAGTLSNATWSNAGKYGGALSFNGTNSWVTVADNALLHLTTGMTLEAWVKPTAASTDWTAVALKERSGGLDYALYAADGAGKPPAGYIHKTSDVEAAGTSPLALNTWSHLAVTYDGANLRLYINGQQVGSKAQTGNIATSTNPLRIGGDSVWGEYFTGLIDEVRVYSNALTQSQVQADMNTPVNGGPDTTAPTVTVTSPANGATVSGNVTITATASDNVAVAGVQFQVDNVNVGNPVTSAPYTITWNATSLSGAHTITAIATDASGNSASSSISVTVGQGADGTPPTVSLVAPAPGASVSGSVVVSASASDNVAVASVQFLLDGVNLGAPVTSAPYQITWNTSTATNGTHQLSVKATDTSGNSTTTAATSVVVSNFTANLTINGAQQFQTIDGFGTNLSSEAWNGGAVTPSLDVLLNHGYKTFRVIVEPVQGWEDTNPNTGIYSNSNPNWAYYNNLYGTSTKFTNLWNTISYLKSHGATVWVNLQSDAPAWMTDAGGATGSIGQDHEADWATMVSTLVYYAVNVAHVPIDALGPMNEPNNPGDPVQGPQVGATQYVRMLDTLETQLQSYGLGYIPLVGPDTSGGSTAYDPAILADSFLMPHIMQFGFHAYAVGPPTDSAITNNATYPGRHIIVDEYDGTYYSEDQGIRATASQLWTQADGSFLDLVKDVQAGDHGAMIWDGVDNYYLYYQKWSAHGLISYDWTAANPTAQSDYGTTPRLYANAMMFQFVPAGSVVIGSSTTLGNLLEVAFRTPSGQITIVGENTGASAQVVNGSLSGGPSASLFNLYFTNSSTNEQQQADVAVTGGRFSLSVPADTIFTLTTPLAADAQPPTAPANLVATGVMGAVQLRWNASTDNVGVAQYNVYRSTAAGFTPSATTLVGSTWTTAYTDTVAAGTYYYRVIAQDGVGNLSQPLNEAAGTATSPDSQPPSAPGNLSAGGAIGSVALSWTAATDNVGVTQYNVYRSTTSGFVPGASNQVGTTTATSYTDYVAAGTYYYLVTAQDAFGNVGQPSGETSGSSLPDTVAPTVSMIAPAAGTTVSGTAAVAASASDNVAVASVQFILDGVNFGAPVTAAPYSFSWNSATVANGQHTWAAIATDASGNGATSSSVSFTVSNTALPGLVASYGLDEGSGTTVSDSSTNKNGGTIANATWATGYFGNALQFTGSKTSLVSVNDSASLDLTTGLTLEAWVKPSSLSSPDDGWVAAVAKDNKASSANDISYALYAANGTGTPPALHLLIGGSDVGVQGTSVLSLNTWTFLAATYDGATMKLYVNGTLVASKAQSGTITKTPDPLHIGGDWSGEMFTGLIDNVRVYNRALSTTEVQGDMSTPVSARPQEVIGSPGGGGGVQLTAPALAPVVTRAIGLWQAAGASPAQLALLRGVTVRIENLPARYLGITVGNEVWISRTAAGYGWFTNPGDDAAFAAGKVRGADLLTTVAHEFGHVLGFDDLPGNGVMAEGLPLGVRRVPDRSLFATGAAGVVNPHGVADVPLVLTGGIPQPVVTAILAALARVHADVSTPLAKKLLPLVNRVASSQITRTTILDRLFGDLVGLPDPFAPATVK